MPDPLTPDDIEAILRGGGSATDKLQAAARLGAERERERIDSVCRQLLLCDYCAPDVARAINEDDDTAAIRRGEGETDAAAIGRAS